MYCVYVLMQRKNKKKAEGSKVITCNNRTRIRTQGPRPGPASALGRAQVSGAGRAPIAQLVRTTHSYSRVAVKDDQLADVSGSVAVQCNAVGRCTLKLTPLALYIRIILRFQASPVTRSVRVLIMRRREIIIASPPFRAR